MEHMDVESGEEALDITGEEISERHVVTESVSLNAYGSPIVRGQNINSVTARREEDVAEPRRVVDRVVCNCKTTCSRKRTARSTGCPCRNADGKCTTRCQCGTKKTCKNRAVEVQPVNRNPSAYARHQRAVEESQSEIQDFVKALSQDEREKLLIRVLSQGRGSLEYARDLLASANDPQSQPPEPENGEDSWCICRVCRRMQDEQENICCRKRTCVTSYVMFNNICLDRGVLELAIRARCDIRADLPDNSTQSYRKAAYRQYTLWKYGKLSRGNRRILPSCVVTMIRQSYPAPDGRYMGYRQS